MSWACWSLPATGTATDSASTCAPDRLGNGVIGSVLVWIVLARAGHHDNPRQQHRFNFEGVLVGLENRVQWSIDRRHFVGTCAQKNDASRANCLAPSGLVDKTAALRDLAAFHPPGFPGSLSSAHHPS